MVESGKRPCYNVSMSRTAGFEVVDHTADWSLRVFGPDLVALFEQAALGMAGLLVGDLDLVENGVERPFAFDEFDSETLLVEWLTELAYWAETERLIFTQFHIEQITETSLKATARGGHVAELQKHIKAVTFHNLAITPTPTGLETTIVFDV
jgi:SHS2 domain-containing protein